MLTVEKIAIAGLFGAPEFPALLAEYALLATIDGMPAPAPQLATYQHLEDLGILHTFSAVSDGVLVGFIVLMASPLPKYPVVTVTTESFFVAAAHRKTGAGLKLLRAAEQFARHVGSPVVIVSAPSEGDLVNVLPRVGYRENSRIFYKRVDHG